LEAHVKDSIGPSVWLRSVPAAVRDLMSRRTRCYRSGLGRPLTMSDGRIYVPFRHTRKTESSWSTSSAPAVLQPRFRLPFFSPRRRRLHALFRVVCIVTTPFFVGLRGFRSKLWMVDPDTGEFAGLYEWDDAPTARAYAEGLSKVLRLLSVRGSVSYELRASCTVDEYLDREHRAA
jgi:hypothetical protein